MSSRFVEQEDSDVNIAIAQDDAQPIATFDVVDDTPRPATEMPWWKRLSSNPKDWYLGAVKEAKDFTWEITEPNHVVSNVIPMID